MTQKEKERIRWTEKNRKKWGTGELPKQDTLLFYGYKEPLRKFEGGFGFQGVLSYSPDKDKVQCHLCGRLFKSLGTHIHFEHKMKTLEYKKQVGLARKTALVGEGTRVILSAQCQLPAQTPAQIRARTRKVKKALKYRKTTAGRRISLEWHNKRGTCPDQLLDKIEKATKKLGHVPTQAEFFKEYNGRFMGVIVKTFGKWSTALEKLGYRTHQSDRQSDESLLDELRLFYKTQKRTPRWTDFKRGLLPYGNLYIARFGSMNRARALARVPYLIHIGRKTEEWMPTEAQFVKLVDTVQKDYSTVNAGINR